MRQPVRQTWTRVVALLLVAVLAASGCSAGDDTQSAPSTATATSQAEQASPAEQPSTEGSGPDRPTLSRLCALVSAEDLEELVGTPFTEAVEQPGGWGVRRECHYETQDGVVGNGSVTLAVASGVRDGVEVSPTPLVSGFPVGGFEADWHQDTGLVVVVADAQVPWLLHTLVRLDQLNHEAKSIELAEHVLSELALLPESAEQLCGLFGPDDFEAVFGERLAAGDPRVLPSGRALLAWCNFRAAEGPAELEVVAVMAHFAGENMVPESGSRRVRGLGGEAYWDQGSGLSVYPAGTRAWILHVAAWPQGYPVERYRPKPDRALSIEAAKIILERMPS